MDRKLIALVCAGLWAASVLARIIHALTFACRKALTCLKLLRIVYKQTAHVGVQPLGALEVAQAAKAWTPTCRDE